MAKFQKDLYTEGEDQTPIDAFYSLLSSTGADRLLGSDLKRSYREIRLMCHIRLAKAIPGTVRFLQSVSAAVVVYCPLFCPDAKMAARVLGLPAVSLLTTTTPGSLFAMQFPGDEEWFASTAAEFSPHLEAVARLNSTYSFQPPLSVIEPVICIEVNYSEDANIVTTIESLADECPEYASRAYSQAGQHFTYVGPLLRAADSPENGQHFSPLLRVARCPSVWEAALKPWEDDDGGGGLAIQSEKLMTLIRSFKASGGRVAYVSLGTVIPGDHPSAGWDGRMPMIPEDQSGGDVTMGLSGREMCLAVWQSAFKELGAAAISAPSEGCEGEWLIVVSTGSKGAASICEGSIDVPGNVLALHHAPQVALLSMVGVDIFVTHGGQNSFMEAIAAGTPIVVCPAFGDQFVNAAKAESLGLGLQVPRAAEGQADLFTEQVADAIRQLLGSEMQYRKRALEVKAALAEAGGLEAAIGTVMALCKETSNTC